MFIEIPDPADWYGFTYQAEILCRGCVHWLAEDVTSVDDPGNYSLAELIGIWAVRDDVPLSLAEFDSGDFPKPFEYTEEPETCDSCGADLEESYENHIRS